MVMISLDEYNKYRNQMYALQTTPVINPMQKELQELNQQYGDSLLPDQKTKLEGEIISKYTSKPIKEKDDDETKVVVENKEEENTKWIKSSIDDFNKTNKSRAKQFYSIIENSVGTKWNSKGEILSNETNEFIPGSNILHLINYVTSSIKPSQNIPVGFNEFINIIKNANVPEFLFSKSGLNVIQSFSVAKEEEQHKHMTPKQLRKSKRRRLKVLDDDDDHTWIQ